MALLTDGMQLMGDKTMTREEEIEKASVKANPGIVVTPGAKIFRECCRLSFQQGAKWADDNPKLPWISVEDDLPCNYDSLLIRCLSYTNMVTKPVLTLVDDGSYQICEMFLNAEGIWEWSYNGTVICWFPIPEPPKE